MEGPTNGSGASVGVADALIKKIGADIDVKRDGISPSCAPICVTHALMKPRRDPIHSMRDPIEPIQLRIRFGGVRVPTGPTSPCGTELRVGVGT
jgi:hypothetical protein